MEECEKGWWREQGSCRSGPLIQLELAKSCTRHQLGQWFRSDAYDILAYFVIDNLMNISIQISTEDGIPDFPE
jgi:hypothetical protein